MSARRRRTTSDGKLLRAPPLSPRARRFHFPFPPHTSLAGEEASINDIIEACHALGLQVCAVPKRHPKADFRSLGRAHVQLVVESGEHTGKPVRADIPSKSALLEAIAKVVPTLMGRRNRLLQAAHVKRMVEEAKAKGAKSLAPPKQTRKEQKLAQKQLAKMQADPNTIAGAGVPPGSPGVVLTGPDGRSVMVPPGGIIRLAPGQPVPPGMVPVRFRQGPPPGAGAGVGAGAGSPPAGGLLMAGEAPD